MSEITKQASLVDEPLALAHFRDRSGVEVDVIIDTGPMVARLDDRLRAPPVIALWEAEST